MKGTSSATATYIRRADRRQQHGNGMWGCVASPAPGTWHTPKDGHPDEERAGKGPGEGGDGVPAGEAQCRGSHFRHLEPGTGRLFTA